MIKYYRALKTTTAWEKGAILQFDLNMNNGWYTLTCDLWDTPAATKLREKQGSSQGQIGESCVLVENSPEWYERVYPIGDKKVKYVTKDKAIKEFEGETK